MPRLKNIQNQRNVVKLAQLCSRRAKPHHGYDEGTPALALRAGSCTGLPFIYLLSISNMKTLPPDNSDHK